MRPLSALPLLIALTACSQAEQPATDRAPPPAAVAVEVVGDQTAIPARFRGEWNADLAACGTDRSDSRLRLGARDVRFYESAGTVKAVEQPSPDRLQVTLALTGEGETWTTSRDFRLSPDGATLTDAEGGLVRRRCP